MQKEDLESVINIESRVFPDPWTYTMFAEQLDLPQMYSLVIARLNDEIVGYGGLLKIRDEGHITNLAVKIDKHDEGIGKAVVYFLFLLAQKENINTLSLEVRTTNTRAQELYKKFGFKVIAVRKNYYGYEDDAFVMSTDYLERAAAQKRLEEIRKNLKFHLEDCVSAAS